VVDRKNLLARIKARPAAIDLISRQQFASARPDTPLEQLISAAAASRIPITVVDDGNHLMGVISRSHLLKELADVV